MQLSILEFKLEFFEQIVLNLQIVLVEIFFVLSRRKKYFVQFSNLSEWKACRFFNYELWQRQRENWLLADSQQWHSQYNSPIMAKIQTQAFLMRKPRLYEF